MTTNQPTAISACGRRIDQEAVSSSFHDLSPDDLIACIAVRRDRMAYAALFTRFAPRIKAFGISQGMTAQEGEDLAQDTLLKVWRKADLFEPKKAQAVTWIYSIARNLRIDLARKVRRVRDLPEDLWQTDPESAADQCVIDGEGRRSLATLIKTLPQEQQTILKLSFFENLSHGEIASTLSIPLGAVKSRMRLALARLKTCLGATEDLA